MLRRGDSKRILYQKSATDLGPTSAVKPTGGDYFTSQHLQDRVRQYAQEAGIPLEYVERYAQESKPVASSSAASLKLLAGDEGK